MTLRNHRLAWNQWAGGGHLKEETLLNRFKRSIKLGRKKRGRWALDITTLK